MRDNEIAAAYVGINVAKTRVLCISLASFFTGIAGSALVHYAEYASPYNYTIDESIILVQMVILGGIGGLPGCLLGTAILIIAPEMSRTFYNYRLLIVGVMMVLMMLWAPKGLLGRGGIADKIIDLIKKHSAKKAEAIGGDPE